MPHLHEDLWYLLMPLDNVHSQGQKNTDGNKSVGVLLMSNMEVSQLEQRGYIKNSSASRSKCERMSHTTQTYFMIDTELKAPLRGRRFHTREYIAKAVRHEITRLDMGNGAADGIDRLPHH
ncbi:hypothetical protein C0J52_22567 [Blattella germanica]|nr:hypothetical protein C0J52_22567 [Blattella germanica]